MLDPQGPLFREARYLLAEETDIGDIAGCHAVLGAIATGNNTRGGIAGHVGRKSRDIGHPLSVPQDTQLITGEIDPSRKGKALDCIAEPLIGFHEAIMRRDWTRLERGDARQARRSSQASFLSQVVGP
ncbi:MAG TPA: hypothetical protein VGO78_08150 [Acidimicrobiales bacterium]|nr:hypothetical protein [Acidimicrobiales bacterium]